MEQLFNLMHRILRISKDQFRDDFGPKQIQTWDSLTHLGLISELEDTYDIEFDVNHISQMRTIGEIKKILKTYGINPDGEAE